jgi:hypothetical protein
LFKKICRLTSGLLKKLATLTQHRMANMLNLH